MVLANLCVLQSAACACARSLDLHSPITWSRGCWSAYWHGGVHPETIILIWRSFSAVYKPALREPSCILQRDLILQPSQGTLIRGETRWRPSDVVDLGATPWSHDPERESRRCRFRTPLRASASTSAQSTRLPLQRREGSVTPLCALAPALIHCARRPSNNVLLARGVQCEVAASRIRRLCTSTFSCQRVAAISAGRVEGYLQHVIAVF